MQNNKIKIISMFHLKKGDKKENLLNYCALPQRIRAHELEIGDLIWSRDSHV